MQNTDYHKIFNQHFMNLNFTECHRIISHWKTNNSEDKISHLHCQARLDFELLKFDHAFIKYEQLIRLKPSFQIEIEYLLSLYHLGLHKELDNQLSKLKNDFFVLQKYNINEYFDKLILLAKIFEAKGWLDETEKILNLLNEGTIDPYQKQALTVYQLRMAAEFQGLPEIKRLLPLVRSGDFFNNDFLLEREHALLLTDFRLNNYESAIIRYLTIIEKGLNIADHVFFQSEFIEQLIIHNQAHRLNEFTFSQPSKQSTYEHLQMKLIENHLSEFKQLFTEFIRYENILDQIQFLRLLRQMIYISDYPTFKKELISKYYCLLQCDVSPKFKKYFEINSKYLQTYQLKYCRSTKIIENESSKVHIRSQLQEKLIYLLENRKSVSIEDAIQALYNEELNTYSYEKLRSLIHRFNHCITNGFGIEAMIKLTDHKLEFQLNQSIICIA